MKKMLGLTILFMLIAGNVMAQVNCDKHRGNFYENMDRCRIANALELIAEKMK
jgi:hypothetical protein